MPKVRTKRAAAKRFKLTGTGKVKRKHSHAGHIFTTKSAKRKRGLRGTDLVCAADEPRVKAMI